MQGTLLLPPRFRTVQAEDFGTRRIGTVGFIRQSPLPLSVRSRRGARQLATGLLLLRRSRSIVSLFEGGQRNHAMAMCGWKECRGVVSLLVLMCLSFLVGGSHGVMVENSFVVSRLAGEASGSIVGHEAVPCGSSATAEIPESHLLQKVESVASVDTGPCVRRTAKSCPVKCFRADPVCGTDKFTYWCGAADANCAGVEVAHDGYCNLWEMDTNIGSTTALHAVQSLQLVHMLWLVVAGLFIVLGLL